MVFKAIDADDDGNITIDDIIYVLSIVMKRCKDNNDNMDRINKLIGDNNLDIVFDGLQRYALIEFGIKPLPNETSLEFEIILSLFDDLNDVLNEYMEPAFEEYGDHYYLISTIWWNKWCNKLNISATYKYDGRVQNISANKDNEQKYDHDIGPIDNTSVVLNYTNDQFILKQELKGCTDYICVAPSIWKVLSKWYNGGPGIRRSIIGNYDTEQKTHVPYLEIYPLRLYVHTKTSPELLDKQREILENLKLERDYKAAEANENAAIKAKQELLQNSQLQLQRRASSIFNYGKQAMSTGSLSYIANGMISNKMEHVYNGNYYQWEIFVSGKTSLNYIKQIILKYDPLMTSMQHVKNKMGNSDSDSDGNLNEMDESKLRFWWLHNERSLVITLHNRMKIKILNTSPSYEQFVKMKKNANGKLSKLFGKRKKKKAKKKKKKKKKKKSKHKYVSTVPKTRPPELFNGDELIGDTELSNNNYIYLEVQQAKGQWEGVNVSKTNNDDSSDSDNENSTDAEHHENENENESDSKTNTNTTNNTGEDDDDDDDENDLENKENIINGNVLSQGVIGLQNLGNTCFLNAAVQCLSHSLPFQQYMLSDVFINEINKHNFLGNNGRVPIAFAALMRALYISKPYSIHSPRNLRSLIQELNPMFEGNLQHDSQEALQFLLQGIHQDLNRIKEKPKGLQCNDSNGRRDEIVAREAWQIFCQTDQSVIVDLFMGQYRSTIKCLTCNRENHKFDTYQMLSLPIPIIDSKFVHILVHFRAPYRKSIKYSFKLPDSTTIQDIIAKVSKIVLIPPHLLIPAHIVKNTIYQIITLNKQITNINLTDIIMLYEAPKWSLLARPQINIYQVPIGFKIGTDLDIKCTINKKWYHGQIVELCHMSQWNDTMFNVVYKQYNQMKNIKINEIKTDENDLRSEWKMKIHYVGWTEIWNEWISLSDEMRINKPGTHCKDVPSEIKYPRVYPAIPYHIITLRCIHRRIMETKATFWNGRGYQLRTFGIPLLVFLPRNGFNAFELYYYIWNFIQLRYLNQNNTYFTSNTNTNTSNNSKQNKEYDAFNAITNAYIHIFGGNVFNNNESHLHAICPPFVLRRVDKFGVKCSQTQWDKYSIGTLIELTQKDDGKMLELDDEEYISIDWNEEFFNTFFDDVNELEEEKKEEKKEEIVQRIADNKSTTFLNNQSLLFDELLDDETVIKHFAQFSKSISIGDCIREFQKEEKLSEYFCEKCNKKIDATKSLRIWSTPPILILHFKRTGNFGRKIDTNVDYLLNNFDMAPFLVPRTIDQSVENIKDIINKNEQNEENKEDENEEENKYEEKTDMNKKWPRFAVASSKQTHYNLFGAINHYGVAGGGHYIANCLCKDVNMNQNNNEEKKSNENENENDNSENETDNSNGIHSILKWYLFDDHRVTTVSPLDVKSKNAYLLFYIRSDIQELFVQNLINKKNENEKIFDIQHIDPDKHFQFLPPNVRKLIGNELTNEQIKLLNSEGVETTTIKNCIIL